MFEMMAILESACARLAAKQHRREDRDALEAAHEAIYRASRNAYVEGQTLALRNRLEPYRRSITFHEGLMERSMIEHQRVIEAMLEMDEASAAKHMDSHVDTLKTDALAMVEALARV